MLLTNSKLIGTTVYSVQTSSAIGVVSEAIINPDNLKIIALKLSGPLIREANLIDVSSIREYSNLGIIIDSLEELISSDDVIKISKIIALNFSLIGLKAETKKGSKLGHIQGYTFTSDDFTVRQIIVRRPALKAFIDPELTISRKEIVEVTDYKVIVKDEEKVLKSRAEKEDFIPNFVNPFRNSEFSPSPAQMENPGDKDTQ